MMSHILFKHMLTFNNPHKANIILAGEPESSMAKINCKKISYHIITEYGFYHKHLNKNLQVVNEKISVPNHL